MFNFISKIKRKILKQTLVENKFVHIIEKDKFSQPFVSFMNENFDPQDSCFIFFCSKKTDPQIPTEYPNVLVIKKPSRLKINSNKVQKIFLHSLPQKTALWLYSQQHILEKCCWIAWGYDMYDPDTQTEKYIKNHVGCVVTNFDKTVYQQKYNDRTPVYAMPFYPSVIKKEYLDAAKKINSEYFTVQINNSADQSTLEMLDILSKFKNEKMKIVTILSYGKKQFNMQILKKGNTLFGNNFLPLMKYLNAREYANHLKNIDIIVLNQKRQQGLGNIRCNFYLQNKVFIRSEVTTYKGLENKGFKIFDSNAIKNMTFDEFVSFNTQDKILNKNLVQSYFDNSDILATWQKLLS